MKIMPTTFTDNSIMPFGIHKGKALANVPNDYLLFLHDRGKMGQLETYIKDNYDAIYQNAMAERRKHFDKKRR